VLKIYRQELDWDNLAFGNLRFDLREAGLDQFSLTQRGGASAVARDDERTIIEICWQKADTQIEPGSLGLVRRWNVPLRVESSICAVLTIGRGATICRHVDRWQREVRWHQQNVYLPKGRTSLLAGALAGCDLYAPSLPHATELSYDSEINEWSWSDINDTSRANRAGSLDFRYSGPDGRVSVALLGSSLSPIRTLREQERTNHLPLHSLLVVGFVLPLPQPEGYGIIPDGLPAKLANPASSALRLPGDAYLYFNRDDQSVRLYNPNAQARDQKLSHGAVVAWGSSDSEPTSYRGTWIESDSLPNSFRGELVLTNSLDCLLARGAISEEFPEAFFPESCDSTLGSSPLLLKSTDGRIFVLVFKEAAKHPVFVLSLTERVFRRFDPHPANPITLGPGVAEFILGATHYKLERISEPVGSSLAGESTFAGGVK